MDWSAIVREHGALVWQTADRILRNRWDTEDCFQETFLAAVRTALRGQIENWPALLRHIAAAKAIDRLRQRVQQNRRVDHQSEQHAIPSTEAGPVEHAQASELGTRLRVALGRVSPKYAEVFCMHYLTGLTNDEIGRELRLNANAVGVLLHRSRAQLQRLMNNTEK